MPKASKDHTLTNNEYSFQCHSTRKNNPQRDRLEKNEKSFVKLCNSLDSIAQKAYLNVYFSFKERNRVHLVFTSESFA